MKKKSIYEGIDEKKLAKLLTNLNSKTNTFLTNQTICYALSHRLVIGIMEDGEANLVRYEYTGERTIIEEVEKGSIFSDIFISSDSSELSVIAKSNCTVTFIQYDALIEYAKTSKTALIFLDNLIKVISDKLIARNERIELLTTRTIRNKLLAYFELQAKKKNAKSFSLNLTYTDLADYLAIDRSALMRELKNLKDDKLIKDTNKKITILYEW